MLSLASFARSPESGRDSPPFLPAWLDSLRQQDVDLHAWAFIPKTLSEPEPAVGVLAGVAVGVKDVIDVAGMPTRCGSTACPDTPAAFDASCVAMLRTAGAVPVGKTVTAEFAYATSGPTRNPVDPRHTPGGSSSGSAAAVAAGMVPLALGTQTGGSIIRPAAFCGVVGFKPTFGLVARDGMKVMCESLDVIGWYTSSVGDAAVAASVLLPSPEKTARQPLRGVDGLHGVRIAFLHGNPGHVLGAAAEAALDHARSRLAAHGAWVTAVPVLEPAAQLLEAHRVLMHYEFARSLQPVVQQSRAQLSARLLAAVDEGLALPAERYLALRDYQVAQRPRWDDWFGDADLVLTSSALGPAPQGLAHTGDSAFNKGWSVLGWPCLHLPTTSTAAGLPLGVQLVARPGADHALLAWGHMVHAAVRQSPNLPTPSRNERR